jgi:Family of unknown function (DUF5906)
MPSNFATTAIEFLRQLRPAGPWVLTAIVPDGGTITQTFAVEDEIGARTFVQRHNGKRNIYYSVNPTRSAMSRKAAKADIAAVEYLLADLDPKEGESPEAAKARYLEALETHEPAPTVIVDSGNGIQCLWKLTAPISLGPLVTTGDGKKVLSPETTAIVSEVEARTEAQMLELGSIAGTQNVDRILRLPGTTNLPNRKKINAGRVACPTKLIEFNDATHPLDAFPLPATDKESESKSDQHGGDIDALPISKRIRNLIRGIDDPKHPYDSRSERVMAVLTAMAATGCADEQMAAMVLDEGFPISAHVRDQKKPEEYLRRQIARARKRATDPDVAAMNETYAVVSIGGQVAVMKQYRSSEGKPDFKLLTVSAFHTLLANKHVRRGGRMVRLPKHWIEHPQRRDYEGLVFAPGRDVPGYYNLWRGFAVEARPGDCSKFLAHLRDNVCRGDEALYRWVVGWLAQIFQQPHEKSGTSLAIRGKQATGKTKVGEVIGSLLGPHFVAVADPRYVTGHFNSHLVSCLLLHTDEAFWAGDHTAEGKIKDLVTGRWQHIEFKGKEPIPVRNFVRLLVTGNPDWVVPAAFEERRFACLEIGEDHLGDHSYFAAIDQEMDNGGREALLHYLLNFDYSDLNLRRIPHTSALLEQKIASMTPERGWWLDLLRSGTLPGDWDGVGEAPSEFLYESFIAHAQRRAVYRRSIETSIGIFLRKAVKGLRSRKGMYAIDSRRSNPRRKEGPIYVFPGLQECRKYFSELLQANIPWEAGEWVAARPDGEDEGGEGGI